MKDPLASTSESESAYADAVTESEEYLRKIIHGGSWSEFYRASREDVYDWENGKEVK